MVETPSNLRPAREGHCRRCRAKLGPKDGGGFEFRGHAPLCAICYDQLRKHAISSLLDMRNPRQVFMRWIRTLKGQSR